jgi:hypothetical protein
VIFYVGLDLGKRRDYSAIVVVERREAYAGTIHARFVGLWVRHVERLPLGTPYPRVVERVREIVNSYEIRYSRSLIVDATGVGAAVVDQLKQAGLGCEITPVTITGGERAHSHAGGWNIPKQDLMAVVQVLLQSGELKIAKEMKGARMLKRELMDVQARMHGGTLRLGAEGAGQHDDLVIALALAAWKAGRVSSLDGKVRLF